MIFAAFVFVPSPVRATNVAQSDGLSAAANNTTGPLIPPGTTLTLVCTHGTITLDGSEFCNHNSWTKDVCDSSSCEFSMIGTVDSGYRFYGWVWSGQASVACGSCLSTTLTVYTPIQSGHYAASVTLDTTPPPPPPTVQVTFVTFENWSTNWIPAEVQVCPKSGSCSNASNGQTLTLDQYDAYTLSANRLASEVSFLQWTTNAGSLSSNSTDSTQFTPTVSGTVSLITEIKTMPTNWAGYVNSPSSSGRTISSVSGEFYLPRSGQYPTGQGPTSNCFGGGTCYGASGEGHGTTCVISSFSETAGDFLYMTVNYLAGTNVISSVTAGSVSASYIGGEFAPSASVAFYDIPSEAGGSVTITVLLTAPEYGDCRAGQLSAGTTVGVVGLGSTTDNATDTSLSVTNAGSHEPSLLLAQFSSSRPSGAWSLPSPAGGWMTGGQLATGTNPGTESALYGYNDTLVGTVTFTETLGDSGNGNIYLSGIVVEFYLQSSGGSMSSVPPVSYLPQSRGSPDNPTPGTASYGIWVGIGGLPGSTNFLWQAGIEYDTGTNFTAFWCAGSPTCSTSNTNYNNSFPIGWGDEIMVTVTYSSGISSFTIQDLSNKLSWSHTVSFSPYLYSSEWIEEPLFSGAGTNINFFNLAINGAAPSMFASYIGEYNRLGVTLLSLYESSLDFSVGAQF